MLWLMLFIALGAALVAAIVAAMIASRSKATAAGAPALLADTAQLEAARAEAAAIRRAAELESAALRRTAETEARAAAIDARAAADAELQLAAVALDDREHNLARSEDSLRDVQAQLDMRGDALDEGHREWTSNRDRVAGIENDVNKRLAEGRRVLEGKAEVSAETLIERMREQWLQSARADAAAKIRASEQNAMDPSVDRDAKRLLEIAACRYQNHFLTERNASNLRVGPQIVEGLLSNGGVLHEALAKAANVQLLVNDAHDAVRLDGLDGVGKEVARRAFAKLEKRGVEAMAEAQASPEAWSMKFRTLIEQEIRSLGKKAFQVLGVQKAHPEIVDLVGALNFRTSYTQNQWLHAVEAAFFAGMMAAELGLDEKLARRATLMHDIGKALTHQIEGSHAVIGADIARRLGEPELIANAIGSHHNDEPANSAYAYLVAAADAMSGARPGARREQTDGFSAKVEDLERIGLRYRGVDFAHAVHGGRELRVYVREKEVDDPSVVQMSTDIAADVSEEMTFPGQIKVTVIRSFEAVATAN